MFTSASIIGLMSAAIRITSELAENFSEIPFKIERIGEPIIDELTGVYSFFILIPIILKLFNRLPLKRDNLLKRIPIYIFVSILIGLTHTALMYFSRSFIYSILNLGTYDYGFIPFRIVMEYIKQFASFWIVFATYSLFKMTREKEEQKLRAAKLEELVTKSRLETLKMQLNPHFLFNTLNMISSTMYEDLDATDKMITNLSDLLRVTLNSSTKRENMLKDEIDILNIYIKIMKARFKDKLKITIDIDKNCVDALVPNFLFQPLVENSIKYGMENLSGSIIKISAERKDNKLVIGIKDNGPGFSDTLDEITKSGVGLSNTIERLETLYGDSYSFEIYNLDEDGSQVNISIPFHKEVFYS
jgi:sensor histidine kinase YesM